MVLCGRGARAEWMDNGSVRERERERVVDRGR